MHANCSLQYRITVKSKCKVAKIIKHSHNSMLFYLVIIGIKCKYFNI